VFTVIKLVPTLSVDSLTYIIEADPITVKFCNTVKLPDTVVLFLTVKLSADDAVNALIAFVAFVAQLAVPNNEAVTDVAFIVATLLISLEPRFKSPSIALVPLTKRY